MKVLERTDVKSSSEVRLVGPNINKIVPVAEAWKLAEDEGLDLVLVSKEDATPLVVRIQDYKKLMFEKKKTKAQKTKKKRSELKEIQLKANISDHDLQTKTTNIKKFLERGDKVKIIVRLKGREREDPKRAWDLINRVHQSVAEICKMNTVNGPVAMAILEPVTAQK